MRWWTKLIFLIALSGLFATSYFLNWMGSIGSLTSGVNSMFWSKMPFEVQALMIGFVVIIIIGWLAWIIRD